MQRDMYAYLHDQTLRLLNQGYVGPEIAEVLEMPPSLAAAWHRTGYYGSVSHNVKADLPALPRLVRRQPGEPLGAPARGGRPAGTSRMGGAAAAVEVARRRSTRATTAGRSRCSTTCCSPDETKPPPGRSRPTRSSSSASAPRTAPGATPSSPGRRAPAGPVRHADRGGSPDIISALSVAQVFDSIAIRIDGPKAWDEHLVISWVITDTDATYVTELRNGVLIHRSCRSRLPGRRRSGPPAATLIGLVTGIEQLAAARRRFGASTATLRSSAVSWVCSRPSTPTSRS